jgi:hypothetical protein
MDDGLAAAISRTYRVFSIYTFGAGSPVPCDGGSLGPLEERLLRLTPIREIPPELLAAHAASLAPDLEGREEDDLRALLPRYFELIAAEGFPLQGWRHDALLAIRRADYRSRWPAEQTQAVDQVLAALLGAAEAWGADSDATVIRALLPAMPVLRGAEALTEPSCGP